MKKTSPLGEVFFVDATQLSRFNLILILDEILTLKDPAAAAGRILPIAIRTRIFSLT